MCTKRIEYVKCKNLYFTVLKKNKIPSAVERSRNYRCLQRELHCELISEKTPGKTWSVPENFFSPAVYESVFNRCSLLGSRLWAISLAALQKFRLAVEKYLQKAVPATGTNSSSQYCPAWRQRDVVGEAGLGSLLPSGGSGEDTSHPSPCRHLLWVPTGLKGCPGSGA